MVRYHDGCGSFVTSAAFESFASSPPVQTAKRVGLLWPKRLTGMLRRQWSHPTAIPCLFLKRMTGPCADYVLGRSNRDLVQPSGCVLALALSVLESAILVSLRVTLVVTDPAIPVCTSVGVHVIYILMCHVGMVSQATSKKVHTHGEYCSYV